MTARDVMNQQVMVVSESATVATAVRLMHDTGHAGLPVVGEGGGVVGVLDRVTLLRIVVPKYADEIGDLAFLPEDFQAFDARITDLGCRPVSEVMRPCDACVGEDTPLMEVAALMVLKQVEVVPVMRGSELVGIIGVQDLMNEIVRCQAKHSGDR